MTLLVGRLTRNIVPKMTLTLLCHLASAAHSFQRHKTFTAAHNNAQSIQLKQAHLYTKIVSHTLRKSTVIKDTARHTGQEATRFDEKRPTLDRRRLSSPSVLIFVENCIVRRVHTSIVLTSARHTSVLLINFNRNEYPQ